MQYRGEYGKGPLIQKSMMANLNEMAKNLDDAGHSFLITRQCRTGKTFLLKYV
jgi:hypothetical protein